MVYTVVVSALTQEQRELYHAESRLFAALFGIPAKCLPPPDLTALVNPCSAGSWCDGLAHVGPHVPDMAIPSPPEHVVDVEHCRTRASPFRRLEPPVVSLATVSVNADRIGFPCVRSAKAPVTRLSYARIQSALLHGRAYNPQVYGAGNPEHLGW
jgi:hypothetical protein